MMNDLDDMSGSGYRSGIKSRSANVGQTKVIAEYSSDNSPLVVVAHREREKRELQDLNDRFANYIETVRFLEFHNKKLQSDIEFYKNKLERLNQIIREIFETELNQARDVIADNKRESERLDDKNKKLDKDANELRDKYEKITQLREDDRLRLLDLEDMLAEKLAIINGLVAKIDMLEAEIQRLKKEYNRLMGLINSTKLSNEQEIMMRKDFETRIPAMEEEIAFKQQLHEQELRELLESLMKDDSDMYRNIFHNELSNALREIRKEYEEQIQTKPSNEAFYQTRQLKQKIQEIIKTTAKKTQDELIAKEQANKDKLRETELNKELVGLKSKGDHLRRRIEDLERNLSNDRNEFDIEMKQRDEKMESLRSKLEDMLKEMQEMLDEKLRLDEEIATYRRLLSGEEQRFQENVMEQTRLALERQSSGDQHILQTMESGKRTNIQKRSHGNLVLAEANLDDKFIVLENVSAGSDEKLDGWEIRRGPSDSDAQTIHTFPRLTYLRAGRTLKVNIRPWTGPRDVVITTVVNDQGQEMASVTQRFSSA